MIPIKDNIPTSRLPVVTIALILINVAVFIWQLSFPTDARLSDAGLSALDQSALRYGAIPYRISHPSDQKCDYAPVLNGHVVSEEVVCEGTKDYRRAAGVARAAQSQGLDVTDPIPLDQAPWWETLFTSMFMHGGWLHIAFNMLFLWIFGNNVEDSMGRPRFIVFYLLAGLAAVYSQTLLQALFTGDSTAPTIGASGAIAGVLGAYALLFPQARVLTLIFIIFFVTLVEIPALVLLAIWFALQFLPAVGQVAVSSGGGGIAYFAHVGGFVFGLAAIKLFAKRRRPEPSLPAY
jgi:membrane associated rhomboid family serine protease